MKKRVSVCVLTLLVSVGCASRPTESPEEVFTSFKEALQKDDFETVWQHVCALTRDEAERNAKAVREADTREQVTIAATLHVTREEMKNMDGRAFLRAQATAAMTHPGSPWSLIRKAEFGRVEIEGARAVVYVTIDGKEQGHCLRMVLEDNQWRIRFAGS